MDTIFSPIFSFRVDVVSPAFGVDTNQKNETLISPRNTDWSFHGSIFFDLIWPMILDSIMDLFGFESVDTLPFLAVSVLLLRILTSAPT